jgi:hypothetical protein
VLPAIEPQRRRRHRRKRNDGVFVRRHASNDGSDDR